jgi:HD-like signal output (HDOD) protein
MHSNLERFLGKLAKEDMPIFKKTAGVITNMTSQDNSSISDLTWSILKDTALTSKVLRLANSITFNRDSRKVSTVSRAVLQLGLRAIKSICFSGLFVETSLKGSQKERVIREMMASFHAAVQARNIALARRDPSAEEIFISSLLYQIGSVAFWCFGGDLAERLDQMIKEQPHIPQEKLEKTLLGFTLQELSQSIAKEWSLSDLLERALCGDNDPKVATIIAGRSIAKAAESDWAHEKLKIAIEQTRKLTNLSKEECSKLIRESTTEALRATADYGLAKYVNLIPSQDEEREIRLVEEQQEASFDFDPLLQFEILCELQTILKDNQFNVNVFLSSLIEGINRGIGMDRVLFAIMTPDRAKLFGRYAIGWPQSQIESFEIHLNTSPSNLFVKAINDNESIWVNHNNIKIYQLLTESIRIKMKTNNFFVAPIVIKRKPIGVLCADRHTTQRDLDNASFISFTFFATIANAILASTL